MPSRTGCNPPVMKVAPLANASNGVGEFRGWPVCTTKAIERKSFENSNGESIPWYVVSCPQSGVV